MINVKGDKAKHVLWAVPATICSSKACYACWACNTLTDPFHSERDFQAYLGYFLEKWIKT